jgi:hypothetical protein
MKATIPEMPAMSAIWTPIAERKRSVANELEELTWTEHPGSIMTIAAAHKLAEAGSILMANQCLEDRVLLVVRPSTRHQRRASVRVRGGG